MDRAEAIQVLGVVKYCDVDEIVKIKAVDMAIAALREQSNEPLTLEQLRNMHGEPVWLVWPDGRIKSKWWIVGSPEWRLIEFMGSQVAREYGTGWIAYRNKLGGADHAGADI